jgi:endonuclease/exonuclease/phosphatase family metal-dependent hydrolase
VVTWNVGEIYWPWQGNQLHDRDVQAVIEALHDIDADVVLLQELRHRGQLALLCGDRYEGAMPEHCGYDRHVAILARPQLGARFVEHRLAPTSRSVLEARFTVGEVPARALDLHFDVFQPKRRLMQAQTAAELIGDPGSLTIAGGDLNYDPAVSARLRRRADCEAEATLTRRLGDVAIGAGPTLIGLLRVDRLFAGGSALKGASARTGDHRLPLGDHAPLICDLTVATDVDDVGQDPYRVGG